MGNYKKSATGDIDEPCQPQVWISILEATFEAVPQAWVQLVFLISSGQLFNAFGLIHLSTLWSIFTIVLRNASDDNRAFSNAMTDRLKFRLKSNNIIVSVKRKQAKHCQKKKKNNFF